MIYLFVFILIKGVNFYEKDIEIVSNKEYSIVNIKGCNFIPNPGEPQLPTKAIYFLIPYGYEIKDITSKNAKYKILDGEYNIFPIQKPQILSINEPKWTEPNSTIYNSKKDYPGKLIEFVGEGFIRGYKIAEIIVYPLHWNPYTKKLKLYTQIEINLQLKKSSKKNKFWNHNPTAEQLIQSIVINPEDLSSYPKIKIKQNNEFEYLIITQDSLVTEFTPLAEWKKEKGVSSAIRTVEWITSNYFGRDNAEKIRNYIKIAAQDSGVLWVLIGGDVDIVPARISYAMTCEAGFVPDEDDLHADLYYSDLDNSWDANNNNIFGEVEDEIDLYPDVFVGRAPVNNTQETKAFVNKTINYEKNPSPNYTTEALFFAEILWLNPYTDAGIGKDIIGELFPNYFNITKLYERTGNESSSSVMSAINDGKILINHDGHGWWYLMSTGSDIITNSDIDTLSNGNKQGILYSIGCWVGAFDYDCIAEHWVRNPNGGGVSMIANSRYGWGSPGNPGYGYSDKLDESFYYNIFHYGIYNIGQTLGKTKIDYIAYSRQENVYRWHQYQVNLLGDPELSIYTDTLKQFQVIYPESIPIGENTLKIIVKSNNQKVSNALVCLYMQNEVFSRNWTNELGEADFVITPTSPGNMKITVSKHNYFTYQDSIKVFSNGAFVQFYSYKFIDANTNNEINPGERIDFYITLKNIGTDTVSNVIAKFRTQDNYITILDSIGNFVNIPPQETLSSKFVFEVAPNCPISHISQFELEIQGGTTQELNLMVKGPILMFNSYYVDSIPKPGDTVELNITIKNTCGKANNCEGKLYSLDPYIVIIDSIKNFGNINPESLTTREYRIAINQNCPEIYFPQLKINLSSGNYSYEDTFLIKIGCAETYFFDDFETQSNWETGGTNNLWTKTHYAKHSGNSSFYCGDTVRREYENNMNCWFKSPKFVVGPDAYLSFWTWFDLSTYGTDGLYVMINDDTLDFIGCGGALDSIYFETDWTKRIYSLKNYPPGCSLQIKFNFISDAQDVKEGFYIDDVQVSEYKEVCELYRIYIKLNDSLFNNNQIIEAGDTVYIDFAFINEGDSIINNVYMILENKDPNIFIISDSVYFGNVNPKQIIKGKFLFTSDTNTPIGHKTRFTIKIYGDTYKSASEFTTKIGLLPGDIIYKIKVPVSELYGLAYDGKNLWVSSWSRSKIYKIDPKTGELIDSIPTPYYYAYTVDIAYGNNYLWVQHNTTRKIYKMRTNGNIIDSFPSPASIYPTGIAYDGKNLWVCDTAKMIYKIDTSGNLLNQWISPTLGEPRGLSFDPMGNSILNVVSFGNVSAKVYEIDTSCNVVPNHNFLAINAQIRAIEVDTSDENYWVGYRNGLICKVKGFYKKQSIEIDTLPKVFLLKQNYPNPFRNFTIIQYQIPKKCKISLKMYNLLGELVKILDEGEKEPGVYKIKLKGTFSNGIYFIKFNTPTYIATKKLIIL